MTRTDAGRLAGFLAVAAGLLLSPALAHGHQLRAPEKAVSERQHMLDHRKVSRAQMRARRRWERMTPAERRRARRAQRRARRGAFVRASAAAGDPADLGSWAPPFVMATDYKGYAVHAAMLHTGKVLMWGQQGAPRGTATYAWLWDPAKGYGSDAVRNVTPTDASGANIPIFCSGMSFLPDGRVLAVGGTLVGPDYDPNGRVHRLGRARRRSRVRPRHRNVGRSCLGPRGRKDAGTRPRCCSATGGRSS